MITNHTIDNRLTRSVRFQRTTAFRSDGTDQAAIIFPQNEIGYQQLAGQIAASLKTAFDLEVQILPDQAILPERFSRLPDEYRWQTLFILGNINNNRVLLPLYTRYYCFSDADYPGGDGYELRTLVNPYGTGKNIILIGGSSQAGVAAGASQLLAIITEAGQSGKKELPHIMRIKLDPQLKQRLKDYPITSLDAPPPTISTGSGYEIYRCIGNYGTMYSLTGDERYGRYALNRLRTLNKAAVGSYGDRHYFIEHLLLSVYGLLSGGLLTAIELDQTNQLLLQTAFGMEHSWWRRKDGQSALGHRHQAQGTFEFFQLVRYLKDMVVTDQETFSQCKQWMDECRTYLDALGRAKVNDQDDETTLNALANCFLYALGDERYEFFERGDARQVALRALALHDNMGAGAGQGGYGESQLNALYLQQDASIAIATCTIYYQDPQFKWVLEHLPHLKEPLRSNIFAYTPVFVHNFATGATLPAETPHSLKGMMRLPITPHQLDLSNNPPEHIEPLGHTVNAPETWQLAEGIGLNHLLPEQGFDKITLRSNFNPEGAYLLLQGFQGGYRWQGHQRAANCIVRFSQFGHIFLVQNTRQQAPYYKNGVQISDGYRQQPAPPIAACEAIVDFDQTGISITRLPGDHGPSWKRLLFWSKRGNGFFVILDQVEFSTPGKYSLACNWRTPGFAKLDGKRWRTEQGDHFFELVASESLSSEVVDELGTGACNPYVLRQFKGGVYQRGEVQAFQNLFYARPLTNDERFDLIKRTESRALILQSGQPLAVCGTIDQTCWHTDLQLQGNAVWISREEIILAAGRMFQSPSLHISCEQPVGMEIDLTRGRLQVVMDTPETTGATLRIKQETEIKLIVTNNKPVEISLPDDIVASLRELAAVILENDQPVVQQAPLPPSPTEISVHLEEHWRFHGLGKYPNRIRNLRVKATPSPLDGFSDQLIDTVVIELRENRGLWPQAENIDIRLDFPEAVQVDYIRLLGDSIDEPIFRTYTPLPENIEVKGSQDGDWNDSITYRTDPETEWAKFIRFRGQLDRLSACRIPIGDQLKTLHIKVPTNQGGTPLVLQEIEVYGGIYAPRKVRELQIVDLFGNDQQQILIVTESDEILLLDARGREVWRLSLPGKIMRLVCLDLAGDGQLAICLGLIGGELRILSPTGNLLKSIQLADRFNELGVFFGWLYTIYEIQIWKRDQQGRAGLVIGGYSIMLFLDPDFNLIGHSWVDGPWINDVLITPEGNPGAGDLWVRTGWNHGIFHYKNTPGFQPSDSSVNFGGVIQPMFREMVRAIPFINGKTIVFDWLASSNGLRLLAAAETGAGLLDPQTSQWVWKIEGTPPVTFCQAILTPGIPKVILAGLDGFISAYEFKTGKALQKYLASSPIQTALHMQAAGLWVIATHHDLQILDENWQFLAGFPIQARWLKQLSQDEILVVNASGEISRYALLRNSDS